MNIEDLSNDIMKMTIIGAYGCGNVGDEALLEGIITKVKSYYSEAVIDVFAGDTKYIDKLFPVKGISQVLTQGLSWSVIKQFSFIGIFMSLCSSQAVIIGGGSLIHERTRYNLLYYYLLALFAKLTGSKVYFYGLSVASLQTRLGRKAARALFSLGTQITVRDAKSFEHMKALKTSANFQLSWDMAFMNRTSSFSEHVTQKLQLPKEYIGINICSWFHSEDYWKPDSILRNQRIKHVAVLADKLIETYEKPVVFINTVIPHDANASLEIYSQMKHQSSVTLINNVLSPFQMKQVIHGADLMISMRLHCLIFCTMMGTPFVTIVYDEKITAFIERIHVIELEVLEVEDLGHISKLLESVEKTYIRKKVIQKKLLSAAKALNQNLKDELWTI